MVKIWDTSQCVSGTSDRYCRNGKAESEESRESNEINKGEK